MKLAIGSDHRGFTCKAEIQKQLPQFMWIDVGADSAARSDYPAFAFASAQLVKDAQVDGAVLLCGSGAGMAIAANRVPGIYAAVAWN